MENLTSNDIVLYVNGQFQGTRGFQELEAHLPTEAGRLVSGIIEKSQGVFLWVSVVVLLLREGLTEGDTISDLQKVLETLPSDLEELYQSFWDTIKPQYVGHASRLFQIHQVSTTTLDVVTFWLADEDNALSEDINVLKDQRRLHIFQIMRRRLNSRTRGLLEISVDGTVDYLHRTVRDWIVPLWNVILSKSPPGFDPHLAMLKALAVEVSNSSYWGEGPASMSFEFWGRVSLCFYHAASTKDLQRNLPLLVQALDRMDADLDTVSKTCVYPNGTSPLYRNTASASMNLSLKHAAPPHWSTSQYTQTEGSFDNTFVGLAAQFAVLPYVREKISRYPALLHHSTSTHSILSCAILGFRYFSRPDIADITDIAAFSDEEIFAVRIELVRLLLGKGALALQPKESQYFPRDMPTREEIRKNAEIYRTICQQGDEIAASEYWNKVGELFDGQMEKERESLVKGQKRPFLSRLFKKKVKK
ncbi:hypothetical protein AK830_g276 [Neonectria ditissima]|uniref:DUF7791 domain-containing protein n=2 Tax=Eukaryota TaxID=2759 RepID=A0A0P7B7K1_9HYPO|nr:hypothetical protein AK830_g276 [Neonectria ditissima]